MLTLIQIQIYQKFENRISGYFEPDYNNLMRLGAKNEKAKPIEILQKKIDEDGRSWYLVKLAENNWTLSWEPLKNLNNYFMEIEEFDKKNDEPYRQWNLFAKKPKQHQNGQSLAEKEISTHFMKDEERRHSIHEIQFSKEEKQKLYHQSKRKWLGKKYRNNIYTTGLDSHQLQKLRRKNKQTYYRKGLLKIKSVEPHFEEQIEEEPSMEEDYESVGLIFKENEILMAQVRVGGEKVVKVPRDLLRLTHPQLLLEYYERVYRQLDQNR